MIKLGKISKYTFLSLLLLEAISFSGYLFPTVNKLGFFALTITALILSMIKLEYGVYMLLAELFVGSKGYLFFFQSGGLSLSIRIALWIIIMSVWSSKILIDFLRSDKKEKLASWKSSLFSDSNKYFTLLIFFILLAGVNGLLNHNPSAFIFDEFKRWLFIFLIFPFFSIIKSKKEIENVMSIFWGAISWLSVKTFLLLFIFSHEMLTWVYPLYRWVRTTGVGEITQIQGGFYRIFIQSHIYVLIGLFILIFALSKEALNYKLKESIKAKRFWLSIFFVVVFLSIILISFSRSFWVGSLAGLIMTYAFMIYQAKQFNKGLANTFAKLSLSLFICFAISLFIILSIVKFPYPKPLGGFNATDLFTERATQTNEAAIGSRWALLPKLWSKISSAPVLGRGFGATITYQSQDPRVLQLNPRGEYTTYAFEWGWLDIWLKLGIFGLLSYLYLLAKMVYNLTRDNLKSTVADLQTALALGLVILAAVNFFTPYLNHPLGITYLIMAGAIQKWGKVNLD